MKTFEQFFDALAISRAVPGPGIFFLSKVKVQHGFEQLHRMLMMITTMLLLLFGYGRCLRLSL